MICILHILHIYCDDIYLHSKDNSNKNATKPRIILRCDFYTGRFNIILVFIDSSKSPSCDCYRGERTGTWAVTGIGISRKGSRRASRPRRKARYRVQHYRRHVLAVEDSQHAFWISAVEHCDVPSGVRIAIRFSHGGYRRRVSQQRLAGLPGVSHGVPRWYRKLVPESGAHQVPLSREILNISLSWDTSGEHVRAIQHINPLELARPLD